jgi:hypothetical protein
MLSTGVSCNSPEPQVQFCITTDVGITAASVTILSALYEKLGIFCTIETIKLVQTNLELVFLLFTFS